MNVREIQDWLIMQIAELLYIEPDNINISEPFTNYGLTSSDAVTLSGDLEELLGRRLSPTITFEYPSISALSHHLAGNEQTQEYLQEETASKAHSREAIAIIGVGCRFPGAKDPQAFWQLLSGGIDAISEIPEDRWPKQAFYHPDPSIPGKAISKWGGFLDSIDQFDPFFFGISPNEAKHMDPQQRLLLELSYEAFDHAGQSKDQLDGTNTGVFVGISVNEYSHVQFGDPLTITSHSGTGSSLSIAANRISYFFNLRGPSISIDTACSSSLAAVHLACQSLRNGECSMALAGGVNLILSPAHSIAFTKAGVLAPDGRCKTFDSSADGYVRGEGGGVVILKPFASALRDGDPVLAVISGSAMAQDGRTNGLMAPSQESQVAMLREAYRVADVSPSTVQYVEAHGTGTLLGDAMEAAAIGTVIGAARTNGPCAIGSVKTNIGHLEAAAGIAGLIKVVLAIKHRTLPPSLNYHSPNPHIAFDALNLKVQNELKAWPNSSNPAIAGVSSFGFGGTNVHLVVSEVVPAQQDIKNGNAYSESNSCHFVPLSANSHENLRSLASSFQDLFTTNFDITTNDICYAASKRRSQHNFRLAAVGTSRRELSESLKALISGEEHPSLLLGGMVPDRLPKLAFVFSGQGGQWYGMGRELLTQEPIFSHIIDRIDRIIQEYFSWSLKDALLAEQSELLLEEIDIIQPAIFAIQVGLAEVWKEWGITPDAVIGHSMGEVAAAYVAGILSLEDAINVICLRSQLLKGLRGQGSMLATELSPVQAEEILKGQENHISIAAINGPSSTVLSGDTEKLKAIMNTLERQNLFCKWVKVDVASHSPQMERLRPEMMELLNGLNPQPAQIPFYSTVTGARGDDLTFDTNYWVENLREPVLFSNAMRELLDSGHSLFIEIGPHPILLSSIQPYHPKERLLPAMRREEPEREILFRSLGALYFEGFPITWENLFPNRGKYVHLPPIPWQRQRYWMDNISSSPKNTWHQIQAEGLLIHPLLGLRIDLANSPSTFIWQTELNTEYLRFLNDHQIEAEIVFPATAYIEMALQAVKETGLILSHELSDFVFREKMVLQKGKPKYVQAILDSDENGNFTFSLFSRNNPKAIWKQHASATISKHRASANLDESISTTSDLFRDQNTSEVSVPRFYESLQIRGLQYGSDFRGIEHLWNKDKEALGKVNLPESLQYEIENYQIHPALLDACLQVLAAIPLVSLDSDLYMPSECKNIRFFSRPIGPIWSYVILQPENLSESDTIDADIRLYDDKNQLIAKLTGFCLKRIGRSKRKKLARGDTWLYRLAWQQWNSPIKSPSAEREKRNWLIFTDEEGLGEILAKQLEAKGNSCHLLLAPKEKDEEEERFLEKIDHFLAKLASPLDGIVHLWSLSIPKQSSNASEMMASLGCNSVLYLMQALARHFVGSPRLWLVTRGAQSVQSDESIVIEQSPLWGLGKVISFELPELKCVRIDLDPQLPHTLSAPFLINQFSITEQEDQIAFRGDKRFVLRLLPFTSTASFTTNEGAIRVDSTYLITGGWGGLGLSIATWMVQKGARHLVLLGRSEPSPSASKIIDQMRERDVEVVLAKADVSKQAELATVFERIKINMPALKGVVHAAGLLDDGSLLNLDKERMKHVMAPKVEGTWNLHLATAHLPLDFFVLFSSAVSVLGSPGQGNYAAASSYLDAMAHFRRNLGLPAISINWGPWAEVGLAAATAEKLREQSASNQHLVKVIKIDQGLEMFELLLQELTPQVAVLPFDLKNLLELYPTAATMPFFAEVVGSDTHVARLYARPKLRQEYVAPRNEIERKLAELWQQTLHINQVGVHDSFFELGGDSVLATQVLALARKTYGISINPKDAFQAFNIERLAEMLEGEILKQIEEMSEEEALRLLSDKNE